jgi:hypothetical protein
VAEQQQMRQADVERVEDLPRLTSVTSPQAEGHCSAGGAITQVPPLDDRDTERIIYIK